MSGKAADQDASPPATSTSEISTAKRLTSEWLAGVMRLPDGTNITSKDLLQACVNVHTTTGPLMGGTAPAAPTLATGKIVHVVNG